MDTDMDICPQVWLSRAVWGLYFHKLGLNRFICIPSIVGMQGMKTLCILAASFVGEGRVGTSFQPLGLFSSLILIEGFSIRLNYVLGCIDLLFAPFHVEFHQYLVISQCEYITRNTRPNFLSTSTLLESLHRQDQGSRYADKCSSYPLVQVKDQPCFLLRLEESFSPDQG